MSTRQGGRYRDRDFIVFRNADTDTVNVLFRRPDGNLGLIEPEA